MQIYFVRHQAAGVVWEYPFEREPSAEQVAAVDALCAQRYGAVHPKTSERYRVMAVAVGVVTGGAVPVVPSSEPVTDVPRIGVPPIEVSGVASVKNP